jgi:hypothetical protein
MLRLFAEWVRLLQSGNVNVYLLYILVALVVLLIIAR